jgi:hypothetical protein
MRMSKALMSIQEVEVLAKNLTVSGLFPGVKNQQQAFTLMMLCQSEGIHPIEAIKRYDIIEGRPAMKTQCMQALFQNDGGKIDFIQRDEKVCKAIFSHPIANKPIEVTVTFDELVRTGVAKGKGGYIKSNYQRHPRQMLRCRCISEGIRTLAPHVVMGMYTPEETQDIIDQENGVSPVVPDYEIENDKKETTDFEKESKKLRAEFIKILKDLYTPEDIKSACREFQKVHNKGIWTTLTAHNKIETFQDVANKHLERVDFNHEGWRELVKVSDGEELVKFINVYNNDPILQTNDENFETLRDRAVERGLWDDETMDFIIEKERRKDADRNYTRNGRVVRKKKFDIRWRKSSGITFKRH